MKVAVIGAGSWGTTIAHLCSQNADTSVWTRRPEVVESIVNSHENEHYLAGFALHDDLTASTDLEEVTSNADVIVMGVASEGFATTLDALDGIVSPSTPVVSLAKGLDRDSGRRMTELISERFANNPVGVLTGPNLAKEILAGQAAASVIAFSDEQVATWLQPLFATDLFRVYTNSDVVGCELGGALKNVIAVGVGMADGLGVGNNTRAAVMTRGLAEITRLGVAMGGRPETFSGLTGMGDLVATCISPQSRNRFVGEALGRGRKLADIIEEMDQVAEGITSASVMAELGRRHGVDVPIADQVCAVVEESRSAEEAYRGLLARPQQGEVDRR